MADTVFTLGVELDSKNAQTSLKDLQKELNKTSESAKGVGKGFSQGLKSFSSDIKGLSGDLKGLATGGIGGATDAIGSLTTGLGAAAGAIVGVGLAVVGVTAALIANSIATAAAADNASELADKFGISTEALRTLQLIAGENSGTVEGLVSVYDKLGKSMQEVADNNLQTDNSFRRLGISQSELAGKTKEEIAGLVIKNYEALGRTVTATAAAQDILGKSFRDQIPTIKEAAANFKDYEKRVKESGAVASQALVDAGGEQEKAFSKMKLAVEGAKNAFGLFFSDTIVGATNWSAKMVTNLTKVVDSLNRPNVSFAERIKIEREEIEKIPVLDRVFNSDARNAATNRIYERVAALDKERQAAKDAAKETARLAALNNSAAGAGRGVVNPEVVTPIKDRNKDEEAALKAIGEKIRDVKTEARSAIDLAGVGGDAAAQQVIKFATEIAKAGKEFITYEEAQRRAKEQTELFTRVVQATNLAAFNKQVKDLTTNYETQIAATQAATNAEAEQVKVRAQLIKQFENQKGGATAEQLKEIEAAVARVGVEYKKLQEVTNTKQFNENVKSVNEDLTLQLQLLTATTEQERERLKLRAQFNKIFSTERGGVTPEQAKALEEALAKADASFAKIQSQKIDNGVRDSLKDLTDQSALLAFETENYWTVNKEGLINTKTALMALEKQIDPEGRGKNISDAQKKALEDQLNVIESQKRLLEQNRQIEDSFKSLGSAVSQWALGSKDAIKNVKIELVKLIALSALKAYGGTGNGIGDLFVNGLISGLSGGRASGGPVEAGKSYLVGEKGPEVVKFDRSGYVIPNNQIGMSGNRTTYLTVSPNITIHGGVTGQSELDKKLDEVVVAMVSETQKFIIRQGGQNGILRTR